MLPRRHSPMRLHLAERLRPTCSQKVRYVSVCPRHREVCSVLTAPSGWLPTLAVRQGPQWGGAVVSDAPGTSRPVLANLLTRFGLCMALSGNSLRAPTGRDPATHRLVGIFPNRPAVGVTIWLSSTTNAGIPHTRHSVRSAGDSRLTVTLPIHSTYHAHRSQSSASYKIPRVPRDDSLLYGKMESATPRNSERARDDSLSKWKAPHPEILREPFLGRPKNLGQSTSSPTATVDSGLRFFAGPLRISGRGTARPPQQLC